MDSYESYKYAPYSGNLTGTRWATTEEVREWLTAIDLEQAAYPTAGLPVISDGRLAYVDGRDSHSLIVGATGSKKTRLFGMPMMEIIARAGESVVVTDPKGEIYTRTSGLFQREGYRMFVFNLRAPTKSHGWNPLYAARRFYDAGEYDKAYGTIGDLASTIFQEKRGTVADPFWEQAARALFQGLCSMLVEGTELFGMDDVIIPNLARLVRELRPVDAGTTGDTNRLLKLYPPTALSHLHMMTSGAASEKTFDSIVASYHAPMNMFYMQKSLMQLLSVQNIDFSCLGKEKTVLYIILPDEKTTLHGLASLFIKQCYEALIDTAQSMGGTLPLKVNFLLDEFSNLPAIPDMPTMISAARSRNIRFHLIIQGMHQMISRYGVDNAQTIKGNCNNWIFLTSRELSLLEELSALCGQNNKTGAALISVSQLQRLSKEKGEALVLCDRLYPYITHLADIDRYPFANEPPCPLPDLPAASTRLIDVSEVLDKARKQKDANHGVTGAENADDQLAEWSARFDKFFGSGANN